MANLALSIKYFITVDYLEPLASKMFPKNDQHGSHYFAQAISHKKETIKFYC